VLVFSFDTPTKVQSHQRGARLAGEIGDLAEHLLCGGVLYLEGSFLNEQINITAGIGPRHPYAIYDVQDGALRKLQPHCFTADSPDLEAFAFEDDAALRPSPPSPAPSGGRRAVSSPSLVGRGDEEAEDVDVEGDAEAGIPIASTSEWSRNLVPSRRTAQEVAEFWARHSEPDKE